ncbi:MAG: ribosomal L7Ae/L30e/S12e/Gadd45 family protein [Syntrophotaleaceae bacterium]
MLNLLGMARKSAAAISGSRAVTVELTAQKAPGLVLMAKDLSPTIADKVSGLAKNRNVPVFTFFEKEILGQVLGKGQRSVVAVADGPLADKIKSEIFRYKHIAGEADG